MALLEPHPALKLAAPESPMVDRVVSLWRSSKN